MKQRGSITVLAAMLIAGIVTFTLIIAEVTRIKIAYINAERKSAFAADTLLAHYDYELFNHYGVIALNLGFDTAEKNIPKVVQIMTDNLNINFAEAPFGHRTETICTTMPRVVLVEIIKDKSLLEEAQIYFREQIIGVARSKLMTTIEVKGSLLEYLQKIILPYSEKGKARLGEAEIEGAFDSMLREDIEASKYIDEYIMRSFATIADYSPNGNGTEWCNIPLAEKKLLYEVENIIGAKKSDKANKEVIERKLLSTRVILNYISFFSDADKQKQCFRASQYVKIPTLRRRAENILRAFWVFCEARQDVYSLMNGNKLSIIKKPQEWTADTLRAAEALFQEQSVEKTGEISQEDIADDYAKAGYEDYLRVYLRLIPEEEKILRVLDLIEINLNNKYGEGTHTVKNLVYEIEYIVRLEENYRLISNRLFDKAYQFSIRGERSYR